MRNLVDGPEMPLGLGMALAQNVQAMNRFAALSEAEQRTIIAHAHTVRSKAEMDEYVRAKLQ